MPLGKGAAKANLYLIETEPLTKVNGEIEQYIWLTVLGNMKH